jgi:hypothetical protein
MKQLVFIFMFSTTFVFAQGYDDNSPGYGSGEMKHWSEMRPYSNSGRPQISATQTFYAFSTSGRCVERTGRGELVQYSDQGEETLDGAPKAHVGYLNISKGITTNES